MEKESKPGFKPEKLLEPFKPENIIQVLKKPDEILLKSLRSLTHIAGGITGINFNFYSKVKSDAKARSELTFIGEKKMEEVKLQLFTYNGIACIEKEGIDECISIDPANPEKNQWLNVYGIHDVDLIESIGQALNLERLTVRQVVDTTSDRKWMIMMTIFSLALNQF